MRNKLEAFTIPATVVNTLKEYYIIEEMTATKPIFWSSKIAQTESKSFMMNKLILLLCATLVTVLIVHAPICGSTLNLKTKTKTITKSLTDSATISNSQTITGTSTKTLSLTESLTEFSTTPTHTLSLTETFTKSITKSLTEFSTTPTHTLSLTETFTESITKSLTEEVTRWCNNVPRETLAEWYAKSLRAQWEVTLKLAPKINWKVHIGIQHEMTVSDEDIRTGAAFKNRVIILPLPAAPRFIEDREVTVQVAYRHMRYESNDMYFSGEGGFVGDTTPAPSQPNPVGFERMGPIYATGKFIGRGLLNITMPAIPFYHIDLSETIVLRVSLREMFYCDDGVFVIGVVNIKKAIPIDNKNVGVAFVSVGIISTLLGGFSSSIDMQATALSGMTRCSAPFSQAIFGVSFRILGPFSIFAMKWLNVPVPTYVDMAIPNETMDDGRGYYGILIGVIFGSVLVIIIAVIIQIGAVIFVHLKYAEFTTERKFSMVWTPAITLMLCFSFFTGMAFSAEELLLDSGTYHQPRDLHNSIKHYGLGSFSALLCITFVICVVILPIMYISFEYHFVIPFRSDMYNDVDVVQDLDNSDDPLIVNSAKGKRTSSNKGDKYKRKAHGLFLAAFQYLFQPTGIVMPHHVRKRFYPLVFYRRIPSSEVILKNPCIAVEKIESDSINIMNDTEGNIIDEKVRYGYLYLGTSLTSIFPLVSPIIIVTSLIFFNIFAPRDSHLKPMESATYTELLPFSDPRRIIFGNHIYNSKEERFYKAAAEKDITKAQAILLASNEVLPCSILYIFIGAFHLVLAVICIVRGLWPARLLNTLSSLSLALTGLVFLLSAAVVSNPTKSGPKEAIRTLAILQCAVCLLRNMCQIVLWYYDYCLSKTIKDFLPIDRDIHFRGLEGDKSIDVAFGNRHCNLGSYSKNFSNSNSEMSENRWLGSIDPIRAWYHRSSSERSLMPGREQLYHRSLLDDHSVIIDYSASSQSLKKPIKNKRKPLYDCEELYDNRYVYHNDIYEKLNSGDSAHFYPRRLGGAKTDNKPKIHQRRTYTMPPPAIRRYDNIEEMMETPHSTSVTIIEGSK